MPAKNVSEPSTLRRSPRAPARVKVKFSESDKEKKGRKRKQSNSEIRSPSQSAEPIPSGSKESKSPKAASKNKDSRKVDKYCWICHSECDDQVCAICPRVYHHQCLNPKTQSFDDGHCPECTSQSVDGTELEPSLLNKLDIALPMILDKISEKFPMFKTWTASEAKNNKLVEIWDLSTIYDQVVCERAYKTTSAFLADVKWIFHNCSIIYSSHDQMTIKSKALVNDCRNELIDFEACAECFLRPSTDDCYVNLCENEHPLVWAKLKGFPYWPAKVLKVIDSVANIRFFGSHDKARNVSIKQCYCMSDESPNDKDPTKATFQTALDEMKLYVQKVVDRRGKYNYFEAKTEFNPGSANFITKSQRMANKSTASKPKRARLSKTADETQEARSQIVVDIDDSTDEFNTENDVQIIGESKRHAFLNNSHLLGNSHSSPLSLANVNPQVVNTLAPTISVQMNIDKAQHFHQIGDVEVLNPNTFFSTSLENRNEDVHVSDGETSRSALENVIDVVEETSALSHKSNSQKSNDFQHNEVLDCSTEPKLETITLNDASHNCQINNDVIEGSVMPDMMDKTATYKTVDFEKANFLVQKYSTALCGNMKCYLQSIVLDCLSTHSACEHREQQLKEEIEKAKKKVEDIKENSSVVIKSIKESVIKRVEKACEDEKIKWEEEMKEKIEERVQEAVKIKQELLKKDHETHIANIEAKHKADMEALVDKLNKEKRLAIENFKKKSKKEFEDEINHIKRTQWCAFCLKEARLFCCWNTSYCNDECQMNHWPKHVDHCGNSSVEAFPDNDNSVTPYSEMTSDSKKAKKSADGTCSPTLPTLRLNGQKFVNNGLNISTPLPSHAKSTTTTIASQKSSMTKAENLLQSQKLPISHLSNSEMLNPETSDKLGDESAFTVNTHSLDVCNVRISKVSSQVEDGKVSNTFQSKNCLTALFNITEDKKTVPKISNLSEDKKNTSKITSPSTTIDFSSKGPASAKMPLKSPKGSPNATSKVGGLSESEKISSKITSPSMLWKMSKILDEKAQSSKTVTTLTQSEKVQTRKITSVTKNVKTTVRKSNIIMESGKMMTRKSVSLSANTKSVAKLPTSPESGKPSIIKVTKFSDTKQSSSKGANLFGEPKSSVIRNANLLDSKTSPTAKVTNDGTKTTIVKVVLPDEKNKNASEEVASTSPKKKIVHSSLMLTPKTAEGKDVRSDVEKTSTDL